MFNPFAKKKMSDQKPEEKKNIFQKVKENFDEKEEQINALSTMVRLGILIWSGAILTLAYIKLPPALKIPEQKLDPTFIASVFTGTLATFGVQAAKKHSESHGSGITKADMRELIEAASRVAPSQTIRIEQAPIKIQPSDSPKE